MALFGTGSRLASGLLADPREDEERRRQLEEASSLGRPKGFWQGGEKFGGRDAVAGLLAVLGDAFANQAGMPLGAVQNLSGGRMSAMESAKARAQQEAVMRRLAASGVSPEDAAILAADKTAVRDVIGGKYKPQSPPALQQNFEWWKSLPQEEQARFSRYQDVVRPRWATGGDGLPYPLETQSGGPVGRLTPIDPSELGGGGGNATGGFPRYRR